MAPVPVPDPSEATPWLEFGWKLAGYFFAFVGGIVSATWVIAKKVNGYDARIEALEKGQEGIAGKIDGKLDRLHQRIDELLINCSTQGKYRHESRGEGEREN